MHRTAGADPPLCGKGERAGAAADLARLKFRGDQARLDAAVESADWAERVGVKVGQYSPEQVLAALPTTIGGARVGFWGTDYAQGFSDEEQNMEQVCARMARAQHRIALDRGIACALGSQTTAKCLERGRARRERTLAQSGGDVTRAGVGGFRPGRGDIMWSQRLGQYSKAVWYLFRRQRVPHAWLWALGLLGISDAFVFRMSITRAQSLSLMACSCWVLRGCWRGSTNAWRSWVSSTSGRTMPSRCCSPWR